MNIINETTMENTKRLAIEFWSAKKQNNKMLCNVSLTKVDFDEDGAKYYMFSEEESEKFFYLGTGFTMQQMQEMNGALIKHKEVIEEADNGFAKSIETYLEILELLEIAKPENPHVENDSEIEEDAVYFSRLNQTFEFGQEILEQLTNPILAEMNAELRMVKNEYKGALIDKSVILPYSGMLYRFTTTNEKVGFLLEKQKNPNGQISAWLLNEQDVLCLLTATFFNHPVVVETLIRNMLDKSITYNEAVMQVIEEGEYLFDYRNHDNDLTVQLFPRSRLYVLYYTDKQGEEEKVQLTTFDYAIQDKKAELIGAFEESMAIIDYLNGQFEETFNVVEGIKLIEALTKRTVAYRTLKFNEVFTEFDLIWSGNDNRFNLATHVLHEDELPCEFGYKDDTIQTKYDGVLLVNPYHTSIVDLKGDEFIEPTGHSFTVYDGLQDTKPMSVSLETEYIINCIQYANLIITK